jgi:hypothetical protein
VARERGFCVEANERASEQLGRRQIADLDRPRHFGR